MAATVLVLVVLVLIVLTEVVLDLMVEVDVTEEV